jgi:hypothetical protein
MATAPRSTNLRENARDRTHGRLAKPSRLRLGRSVLGWLDLDIHPPPSRSPPVMGRTTQDKAPTPPDRSSWRRARVCSNYRVQGYFEMEGGDGRGRTLSDDRRLSKATACQSDDPLLRADRAPAGAEPVARRYRLGAPRHAVDSSGARELGSRSTRSGRCDWPTSRSGRARRCGSSRRPTMTSGEDRRPSKMGRSPRDRALRARHQPDCPHRACPPTGASGGPPGLPTRHGVGGCADHAARRLRASRPQTWLSRLHACGPRPLETPLTVAILGRVQAGRSPDSTRSG